MPCTMKHHLTRIDPTSVAKIAAVLYGLISLVAGAFVSAVSLVGRWPGIASNSWSQPFSALGFLAIVIAPILGALEGLIGGYIGARLYNMLAAAIGPIEIEILSVPQ